MSGAEIDAYLAARPEDQRAALQDLRDLLKTCLPRGDEVMSYAMPGVRLGQKMVVGYAGFARHSGYYPHSGKIIPAFAAELDALGFRHGAGAVQFTPSRPLPPDLVRRLVAARLAEIGDA